MEQSCGGPADSRCCLIPFMLLILTRRQIEEGCKKKKRRPCCSLKFNSSLWTFRILAFALAPLPALTFLVLQPELLLGLLAGEVDAAAELGAVQRLRHVVAAVLLEERQQLVAGARRRQRLQHLGKAWRGRERRGWGFGGEAWPRAIGLSRLAAHWDSCWRKKVGIVCRRC